MTNQENKKGNRARLTRKLIDKAQADHLRGKRVRLWDTDVPQLYVQITPGGSASYYIRYPRADGSKNDFRLCAASIPPEDARRGALQRLAALQLEGIDPSVERRDDIAAAKRGKVETVSALAELFDEAHPHFSETDKRARSYLLGRFVLPRIGDRPFREITKPEMKDLVRSVQNQIATNARHPRFNGHSTANQIQSIVRRMYNWAITDREWLSENPASFPALFEDNLEQRPEYFDPDSFSKIWHENVARATGKDTRVSVALATLIYLVTLQRPVDVARAQREHINLAESTWIVPKHLTKKKRKPYYVPLSPLAVRLIQFQMDRSSSIYLFPSHAKEGHLSRISMGGAFMAMRNQMVEAGDLPSKELQLYDGRRYGRTVIEEDLGYPERVAEHVINHFDENHPSRRYNVRTMREKVRIAQHAWSDEIARMVGPHAFSPPPSDEK
ncbi:integrase arm-type DNA-binding domain-containing protein [Brevundimonas diminuta]|uniref:tyrosine-type recombinase/integrase n=1 Tax=Brevundimonas diminuta TaxID=293 RepID=UPI001906926B|nr:integrase arm-type DNA-binding domain-containing protein [Brevundimonas diminuta]MBK1968899.1 integrase arm-type DNA-binding domain-containing protein [Brevundimonas diminuta]